MPNLTAPVTATRSDELNVSFVVHGEPISKSRARFTKRGYKTVAYTPEKTKAGEMKVALAFRQAKPGHELVDRKFYGVDATFYCGTRQRRDVDNMLKLILDGLNNVAYPDDNAVLEVVGRKRYVPKGEARTEITIYGLGDDEINMEPCTHCGELFRMYESWQDMGRKFCTIECAYESRRKKRECVCEYCGKPFLAHSEARTSKCCSKECSYANRRAEINCAVCNDLFTIQKCHVKEKNYCSDDCRRAADRESKRANRPYPGTCRVCGGGTSRKEYTRCKPCKDSAVSAVGKPKKITITEVETHQGGVS